MDATENRTARERILAVASALFYAEGVHAVGVDRVIADAEVAKATFYRHFRSKELLIAAYIEERGRQWLAWLEERVTVLATRPATRPLAVFDALHERCSRPEFRGCAFTNTIAEFPDPDHPAHAAAARHKRRVTAYLKTLLEAAGYVRHRELAAQLMLLVDGAVVTAIRERSPESTRQARRAASALLALAS